ncbi:hypothetical protein JY651_02285 [Pyxidicoccus parkwayensis]|uniref:Uncharacterized protein n=1 Tax=Pyxidicoccus parkwayensis TaxID=2813578 RepID=A0ABX7NY98_9BACT|nr:hypothetical protein [Pyxidicoccus parkwaysis]QSQ23834.1 hypothetical protein JY651_02285 [Pyxidicoccus parkwaysis]
MSPLRCRTRLVSLAGLLAMLPMAVLAASPSETLRSVEGLSWELRPVRAPVPPADVRAAAPYVPDGVPQVTGAVQVGPERAAALWLGPLDVARVTGTPGTLRFVRVPVATDAQGPHLRLEEEGVPEKPGRWYLAEPMGPGSIWVVTATKPGRIWVERPQPYETTHTDEAMREALLRWVDGQGPRPPLPFQASLRTRLELDAELEATLAEGVPENAPLRTALRDWRKAEALREWTQVSPLRGASLRVSWPRPPGAEVSLEGMNAPWVRPEEGTGSWAVELEGPGVLVLEVRPVLHGTQTPPIAVEVRSEGATLALADVAPEPAWVEGASDVALPEDRRPRLLPSGEHVGTENEVRVALRPGKHAYRVHWDGSNVLLRSRVVSRRPKLGEALAHESTWVDHARKAWDAVKADTSPRAAMLRRQLVSLAPELASGDSSLTTVTDVKDLSPLLRAMVALDEASGDRVPEAMEALRALQSKEALTPLAWHLRLRAARMLLDMRQTDEAHALLGTAPSFPEPGWLAAEAAALVARLPLGDPLRSRELAALELAWRAEPLSEEIRHRYRSAWWRASHWSRVMPTLEEDAPALLPTRWLDVQARDDDEGTPANGALWPLTPGTTIHVQATGPAEAPTMLRAYVVTSSRAAKPLVLRVGEQSFPLLPLSTVEPVEIALPPGAHAVRLDGGADARAYLSLPPAETPDTVTEVGYLRTQWPVRVDKKAVRFRVPDAKLPTPVRLQLRGLGDLSKPVTLRLHTDVGRPQKLVLMPGRSGSLHHSLEGAEGSSDALMPDRSASLHHELEGAGGTSGAPVSVVVMLPPLAREVWFEVEDPAPSLVASLSVRRGMTGSLDTVAPAVALAGASAMDTLLTLSRRLRESPEDAEPRLARAELLLSLQEDGFARADLVPLLKDQRKLSPEQSRRLLALLGRMQEDGREGVRFTQAITAPTLVSPAYSVLPGAEKEDLTPRVAKAREVGTTRALEALTSEGTGTVAKRYLRARWLAASGQDEAAALSLVALYRETNLPQVGLEALALLERLESSPKAWSEGGAPLGAALAAQLEGWADHPRVRHMRALAGRWTHWERLRDAEQTAGLLDALADGDPEEPDTTASVRKALLAPPWPLEQGRLLPSGRSRVLSLDVREPRPVGAQVLCGSTPRVGADGPKPPCTFALRVDGRTVMEQQVEDGKTALLTFVLDARGRHQVEVLHGRNATPALGLVRFVDPSVAGQAAPLSSQQPLTLLRSKPGTPVVMTVLGPGALRIQARAVSPQAGRQVLLSSVVVPSGEGTGGAGAEDGPTVRLGLPEDADPTVKGVATPVGLASETWLLLPGKGPHQVRLESPEGEALVRVDLGVTEPPDAAPGRWWEQASSGLEPLPWPALPPRLSLLPEGVLPAQQPRGPGMISAEVAFRREEVEEGELMERPLRSGLDVRVGLRRELVQDRAWLRIEPEARYPTSQPTVFGATTGLYVTRLPLSLRLNVHGAFFTQSVEDTLRWSARGRASVDRWVRLSPDVGLVPSLGLAVETSHGGSAVDPDRYDQSVFWRYGEDHPKRLMPKLTLRWQPFQDHVGTVGTFATTNSDLGTLDHAGGAARWAALLGGPLRGTRAELGYELTYRLRDEHRAEAYLRHRVAGRLDWNVWVGNGSRLMLFAEDRALLSDPFGLQNVFSVGARWDWMGGRGLRDISPPEEEFEELLDAGRSLE